MQKKHSKTKGVFGDINLSVAKQYIFPPSRSRTGWLGWGAVLAAILFAAFSFFMNGAGLASKGPLSSNHANLQKDCAACHTPLSAVTNDKCSVCHEKYGDRLGVYTFNSHYLYRSNDFRRLVPSLKETPCYSCHVEHAGREARITNVPDDRCLGCHRFGSFNKNHPNFIFEKTRAETPGIKFTHIRHVKEVFKREGLADMEKACLYCHNPMPDGKYFQPIAYDRHCGACHLGSATATPRLPVRRENAPGVDTLESIQAQRAPGTLWALHANPAEFRQSGGSIRKSPVHHRDPWIMENLRRLRSLLYRDSGLADLLTASAAVPAGDQKTLIDEAIRTLKDRSAELRSAPNAEVQKELDRLDGLMARAARQVDDPYGPTDESKFLLALERRTENLTGPQIEEINGVIGDLTKLCRDCHEVEEATIVRVQKDQRTLWRAEFDHRAHILQRRCLDCHVEIPIQEYVSVPELPPTLPDRAGIQNLPTIETCRQCHNPGTASNRCVTCHLFHPNKSRRSDLLLYLD